MAKPIINVRNQQLRDATFKLAQPRANGAAAVSTAAAPASSSPKPIFNEQESNIINAVSQSLDRAPFYRAAYEINDRASQVMTWGLPSGSMVQMYINPENFVVRESKQISQVRTKGGFIIQYWGENLTELTISGTTGSSGVRGINILRDIYRSEARGFDLVAAQINADIEEVKSAVNTSTENLNILLEDAVASASRRNFLMRPSLAAMAVSVILFYIMRKTSSS